MLTVWREREREGERGREREREGERGREREREGERGREREREGERERERERKSSFFQSHNNASINITECRDKYNLEEFQIQKQYVVRAILISKYFLQTKKSGTSSNSIIIHSAHCDIVTNQPRPYTTARPQLNCISSCSTKAKFHEF